MMSSFCAKIINFLKKLLEGFGFYEPDSFAPFDEWKPKVLERSMTSVSVDRILRRHGFSIKRIEGAEIFDATVPFANRIPGLFRNSTFLKFRSLIDHSSSWYGLKWLSLHGIFHAILKTK